MSRLILLILIIGASAFYWRQQGAGSAGLSRPGVSHATTGVSPGNHLAIGAAAKIDAVELRINSPAEFDRLSKDEVLRMRQQAVMAQAQLLAADYLPSENVFGQIADGAPWWGINGMFHRGAGSRSIDGSSEESRFILNPYLLVAPEFDDLWDTVPDNVVTGFPLTCYPQSLSWWPREARAEAVYSAACIGQRQRKEFDLIAYNARDLGLGHIYVSYADSHNVSKLVPPLLAYDNPQYIHKGDSCGYPGGCNNMSPRTPPIDGITLDGLPARIVVWLWRKQPQSVDVKPDFKYVIEFQ